MKKERLYGARRRIASFTRGRSGQAMLLAILTLGATMLGATTIAGLLMLYQIRQVTNFRDSAAAIFAADAGTEWELYSYFKQTDIPPPSNLGNGATVSAICYDATGASSACSDATDTVEAISVGSAGNTKRAFIATFAGAPGSLP
jgi:hypothetical protein